MYRPKIWVVGDSMLDVEVTSPRFRRTPEDLAAPVLNPYGQGTTVRYYPGGAANLVANLVNLGCDVDLFSGVGGDEAGVRLGDLLPAVYIQQTPGSAVCTKTTTKTRYYEGSSLVARVDDDAVNYPIPPPDKAPTCRIDAIVLTDYGRGVINPTIINKWCAYAENHGIPLFADPKVGRTSGWRNQRLFAMVANWEEALDVELNVDSRADADLVSCSVASDADVGRYVVKLKKDWGGFGFTNLIVKRGCYGSTWCTGKHPDWVIDEATRKPQVGHVRAVRRQEVISVQGAGDSYLAGLVTASCRGADLPDACVYASAVAGVAVSRHGTHAVSRDEVIPSILDCYALEPDHRVVTMTKAAQIAKRMKAMGLRVGYTNGCFDVRLHAGHRYTIRKAVDECDYLFVGVDCDDRVNMMKGPGRPVVDQKERAQSVAALHQVDAVFVFDLDPADVLKAIKPDVLVKGGDYTRETVPEAAVLKDWGGVLKIVDKLECESTSSYIARVNGVQ